MKQRSRMQDRVGRMPESRVTAERESLLCLTPAAEILAASEFTDGGRIQ